MSIEVGRGGLILGLALSLAVADVARADQPLSAIDWLSQSLAAPRPVVQKPATAVETAVAAPNVTVQTLGAQVPDALGLLSTKVTGLPKALWGDAPGAEIETLINDQAPEALPALQGLLITLLLAEADAPVDSGKAPQLLLTRIDKLLALGALDQARALIEAAGPASSPELFRRSFDTALLVGEENRACAVLAAAPGLSPALPTRIFCLARQGDWDAAQLTLDTATALGQVDATEADLLTRFLDPDAAEQGTIPAPPVPVTPLDMKIFESIGEPLPTASLPIAFSHADLSPNQGWKARIEAGERLARVGAITPNLLLGLYTEQKPAASGGVWDRTAAFQALDSAVEAGDGAATARALPGAWAALQSVELEVPLADLFADKLARLPLSGEALQIATRLSLLSAGYESLVSSVVPQDAREAFLIGIARGQVFNLPPPDSMGHAIAQAFTAPAVPDDIAPLVQDGRVGEAILMAMARITRGAAGDLPQISAGLSTLRRLGLEDVARRTALELMLLDRHG
jgi:hypothetical protein